MGVELSAVVPIYNEGPGVGKFIEALAARLARHSGAWEIVAVDDGSRDGGCEVIRRVAGPCRVRLVRLSRNFGKESALSAGLALARGRGVVMIDADFQHPIETIDEFVRLWKGGAQMVYGLRASRATDGVLRRWLSQIFYRVFNWLCDIRLEPGAGDFRLLDRCVVDAINSMPERRRFMKGLYSWVGFQTASVVYEVQPRAYGETKWGFGTLGRFAMQGLISFSERPLKLLAHVGLLFAAPALAYGIYILAMTLFSGNAVPGWPTVITAVIFFGGINLVALSLIGRYIGELFLEAKGRPSYLLMSDEDFVPPEPVREPVPRLVAADVSRAAQSPP